MRTYELIYLISSELKAEEAGTLVSEINALLQEEGATITRAENPVPKTLSYQIKKQGTAFQASVEFSLLPEKIKTVEDKIRKNQRIIRYLLIFKKPEPKETTKRAPRKIPAEKTILTDEKRSEKTEKKVKLDDIEKKLEEILKE